MKTGGRRIAFQKGFIDIVVKSGILTLQSSNLVMELRPRAIILQDKIRDYEETEIGKTKRKKVIYLHLEEAIEPFKGRGEVVKEVLIENYEIRRQDLGFEEYITIVTPGTHLYEYIIISSDTITVSLSAKRQAYVDKEDHTTTIYFV
ncbi:hypothetical protein J4526_08555 [Desulfurococcaceae archaeon MEX13E-LK6-19]|nr:hypothetical protein J4526_08555 [Desulfurococcaceae archaeon MEX13E-LK6-19]